MTHAQLVPSTVPPQNRRNLLSMLTLTPRRWLLAFWLFNPLTSFATSPAMPETLLCSSSHVLTGRIRRIEVAPDSCNSQRAGPCHCNGTAVFQLVSILAITSTDMPEHQLSPPAPSSRLVVPVQWWIKNDYQKCATALPDYLGKDLVIGVRIGRNSASDLGTVQGTQWLSELDSLTWVRETLRRANYQGATCPRPIR